MPWVRPILKGRGNKKRVYFGKSDEAPTVLAGFIRVLWPDKTEQRLQVKMVPYASEPSNQRAWYSERKGELPNIPITIPHTQKKYLIPLHEAGCRIWWE